jgi:hypothetical protein
MITCTIACAIGTAILHRFNKHFSSIIDTFLAGNSPVIKNPFEADPENPNQHYHCYYEDKLTDIPTEFFLHDVGECNGG